MALDPDYIRRLHPLDLDPDEIADEIERLRDALAEIAETPSRRWQRKIAKAALDTKEPKA